MRSKRWLCLRDGTEGYLCPVHLEPFLESACWGKKNNAMSDGIQTRAVGRRTEDGLLIRLARQLGLQGTGHGVPPCLPELGPDTRGMEADGGKGL